MKSLQNIGGDYPHPYPPTTTPPVPLFASDIDLSTK